MLASVAGACLLPAKNKQPFDDKDEENVASEAGVKHVVCADCVV